MATYLDEILLAHRTRAASDLRSEGELADRLADAPPPRGFASALVSTNGASVIAELKRRSPSRGDLAPDLDPHALARSYAAGGAACLSVLTDAPHFGGSAGDLVAARGATSLPVLRKDFTVDRRDLYDARLMGADAVLLIVAALSDRELTTYIALGCDLGLDALVEVHDERELERALAAGASVIGVNQRDLHTFVVDPERACRVGEAMPEGIVRVAESGITCAADVVRLVDAGFHAILVGEALVTSDDPVSALAALVSASLIGGSACS
ncbi:MAG TPA: indole-3-glycerol phosphate synthase TrpC [Acidimicrobiales bacterium]|nr:indole-3-glycerol phosphate synthase TrpC [Acidimicrobiales bacterium]